MTYAHDMGIGDVVEDFSLLDQYGHQQSLYRYLNWGPVVLFFYPAAMTKGCTREACHFRDLNPEFDEVGARRIGVSKDSVEKLHRFTELHRFGYTLLSDTAGDVSKRFGVQRSFRARPLRRWTFIVDSDHKITEIIKSEIRMAYHADRALTSLRSRSNNG